MIDLVIALLLVPPGPYGLAVTYTGAALDIATTLAVDD